MQACPTIRFLFILALACTACRKGKTVHPDPLPPDTTPPFFYMYENVGDTLSLTDTSLTLNDVDFIPVKKYDSVTWNLDNGAQIKKGPTFRLKPADAMTYTLQMIGYRRSSYTSTTIIIDTVVRRFTSLSRSNGSVIAGRYKGIVAGQEKDSFTVTLYRIGGQAPPYHPDSHVLSNLPNGCLSELPPNPMQGLQTIYFGYKTFQAEAGRCFYRLNAYGTVEGNRLTVDYFVRDSTRLVDPGVGVTPHVARRFVGVRM